MEVKEFVKGLREHAERFNYDGWIDTAIWFEQAADAIEQLDKDLERAKEYESFWEKEATEALRRFQVAVASKPRWIPVTERLPEKNSNYLVYGRFEPLDVCGLDMERFDGRRFIHSDDVVITHWMPLPTPPKEDEA